MLFESLLVLLLGTLAGTITGLIPGIHTNLLSVFIISSLSYLLLSFSELSVIIFITAMAISHTFLNFIPSIFLGAPDEDTVLGVLPGHKFLLRGLGHEAILLTLLGSVLAIVLLIIITPVFMVTIPLVYPFIHKMMAWFLIWISILLIFSEKSSKLWATIIFLLAGFLGISTLSLPLKNSLLPLLTGLFGSSTLLFSISKKTKIPSQKISRPHINKTHLIRPAIATTIVSPIFAFLPGLGSSQAAIVSSRIIKQSKEQFLILLGSINTLVMAVSFLTLYLINKSRTGAASAIQQISHISPKILVYILITIVITSIISIYLTTKISKLFAKNITKINYSKISFFTLAFLTIVILFFAGLLGLIVFIISTFVGLTCIYVGVRRGFLMGALLIPTILFYLPF